MADILIERQHTLGLAQARELARQWGQQAEDHYQLACAYAAGEAQDVLSFARAGVSGILTVSATAFTLSAQLGCLLSAFKPQIEAEMTKKLNALVQPEA